MDLQPGGLLVWLIVGLIAGSAAGQFMKGSGFGLIGDIIVGIIGAFIGGTLFGFLMPGRCRGAPWEHRRRLRRRRHPDRHTSSRVNPSWIRLSIGSILASRL